MTKQKHRLAAEGRHPLHGSALDRHRPLQFTLDGRVFSGFAGDTVLSAVLAAGVDTVGLRAGVATALSTRHAPTIVPAASARDLQRALPMERTPAVAGTEYVTASPPLRRNMLARLLRRGRSLHTDLDRADASLRPWLGSPTEAGPACDLIVIGGGVAGMSAALAGAKRGQRVVLVEASPLLGGRSHLFGTQDGEENPHDAITRLTTAIAATDAITVLTSADVFALRPGMARLHQVDMSDGVPAGRVMDIHAPRIVLATGALERLPIFSGNRLPGVIGALEAFELARLYGVWSGSSALLATSSSPAYRLAMLAQDAGIAVTRILDARPQPQSRFIEFAKAYGITMASGTVIASAATAKNGGIVATPRLALAGLSREEAALQADRLIVCGGWQPDLTLWHLAGGESAWNASHARLDARSGPDGVVLAGSAAGWQSRSACLASGTDAVDLLLGRQRRPVADLLIDPLYETPDAPAPLGDQPDDAMPPAFLDGGWSHIERPRRLASRWPDWLPFAPRPPGWSLADTPRPLDIADIVAGVQLGAIPAASAGIVAQERVAMVLIGVNAPGETPPAAPLQLVPPYLEQRYPDATLWLVVPDDARRLAVGALIYADADQADPLEAIGVVLRIIDGHAVALVAGVKGQSACVREQGRAVGISLAEPYAGR